MIIVRQSTVRTLMVGPVLDATGVAVTDGVVGDFKISKNGGIPAALNGSATLTHRVTGHYSLALTTSDLDTVGQAEIIIDDTVNACPIKEITIIEEVVYDAFFVAAATGLPVITPNWLTAAGTAADFGTEVGTAVWINGTRTLTALTGLTVDTVTTLTNLPPIPANWLTAAGTALDFTTEIQAGLATAANLATVAGYLDTEIAAIQTAVVTNIPATLTTISTYIDTEVAAIKVKTDQLTFTTANHLDSNVKKINDISIAGAGVLGNKWRP